jgi:hypothetical protein
MALYHFTVPTAWTLACKGCRSDGDSEASSRRPRRGCGAAIHANDFSRLRTPLPRSDPELKRLARLQSGDADARESARVKEHVSASVREHNKTVPFDRAEPFYSTPNRGPGRFLDLLAGRLQQVVESVPLVDGIILFDEPL